MTSIPPIIVKGAATSVASAAENLAPKSKLAVGPTKDELKPAVFVAKKPNGEPLTYKDLINQMLESSDKLVNEFNKFIDLSGGKSIK